MRLALIGDRYEEQFRERPEELAGLEMVYCGASARFFSVAARKHGGCDVFVIDLEKLDGGEGNTDHPARHLEALREETGARLAIVTYTFARREMVDRLTFEGVRPMQQPATLTQLRAGMLSVIVGSLLKTPSRDAERLAQARAARRTSGEAEALAPRADQGAVPAIQFDSKQLARFLEMVSAVECECPNHLAKLLISLRAFEDYSRGCESRSDEDATLHGYLYRQTAEARAILEKALAALAKHEGIAV